MELHNLVKTNVTKKKRLGQGHGSGRVKTAGRGTKGQKARRNIPLSFEGGALSLIKRLPFLRGKGKNKAFLQKYAVINVADLANLPKDTVVDVETLVKHHILSQKAAMQPVKILGDGSVSVPLEIRLPISKQAQEKIEKAGGKVVLS